MKKVTFRVSDKLNSEFKEACKRRGVLQQVAGEDALREWVYPSEHCLHDNRCGAVIGFVLCSLVGFAAGLVCGLLF